MSASQPDKPSQQDLDLEVRRLRAELAQSEARRNELQTARAELEAAQSRLEAELRETQAQLEQLRQPFDPVLSPCLALTSEGIIANANPAACELLQRECSQLQGRMFRALLPQRARKRFDQYLERCRGDTRQVRESFSLSMEDGRLLPVELIGRRGTDSPQGGATCQLLILEQSHNEAEERERKAQEELLTLALRTSGAAAWEWNLRTEELHWSAGVFELFGRKQGEHRPSLRSWLEMLHPDDREGARNALRSLRSGAQTVRLEFRVILPEGGERWFVSQGNVVRDTEQSDPKVVGITSDITKYKQNQDELQRLNRQLQLQTAQAETRAAQLRELAAALTNAEQHERQRLGRILHDHLQQWLIAAKMQLNLLEDEPDDEMRNWIRQKIESTLDEAVRTSRSLAVELSPPVLHDRGLRAAMEWLARRMLEQHQLQVEIEWPEEAIPAAIPVQIVVFEVIRELLLNIVKHAETDRAWVRALLDKDGLIHISIIDRGLGFDVDATAAHGEAATGFGLAHVRHRLELMGGRLDIQSVPRGGSEMTIVVPRQQQPSRQLPPEPLPPAPPSEELEYAGPQPGDGQKIRVLIADDHKIVRVGLSSILKRYPDIQLIGEAEDGVQAVELTRRLRPDVVIMDVNMPRMNGLAATHHIMAEMPGVRVIGLSLHEEADMASAMRDAGACAYLTKGGPSEDLCEAIRAAR